MRASYVGQPHPTVEWLKNGEPVNPQVVSIILKEDETIFTIPRINVSDEGEYLCRLKNTAGTEVAKCQIDVEKKRVPKDYAAEEAAAEAKEKKKSAPRKPREPREPREPRFSLIFSILELINQIRLFKMILIQKTDRQE